MNTDYFILEEIFKIITISPSDVLVDVGCGKGRVIIWWIKKGYKNKIIGIELDPEIAKKTRKRLSKYNNVIIIEGDVLENIPKDGTIFYLFNPFNQNVMKKFKDKLEKIFLEMNKEIQIIYYNCLHVDIFKNDPNWLVKEIFLPKKSNLLVHKLALIRLRTSQGNN